MRNNRNRNWSFDDQEPQEDAPDTDPFVLPSDIDFRTTVLQCATAFMDRDYVAHAIFQMPSDIFDKRCVKEFGMSAKALFDYCAAATDLRTRKVIAKLAYQGNNTALDLYTKHIDVIQQEKNNAELRVSVAALPSSASPSASLLPDDGFHVSIPKESPNEK